MIPNTRSEGSLDGKCIIPRSRASRWRQNNEAGAVNPINQTGPRFHRGSRWLKNKFVTSPRIATVGVACAVAWVANVPASSKRSSKTALWYGMPGRAESGGINALAQQAPNPYFRNIRRLHCFMCDTSSGTAGLIESLNIISPSSLLRGSMRALFHICRRTLVRLRVMPFRANPRSAGTLTDNARPSGRNLAPDQLPKTDFWAKCIVRSQGYPAPSANVAPSELLPLR